MIDIKKCHLLTLNTGDTLLTKLRHRVAIPLPTNPTIPAIIGLSLLYDFNQTLNLEQPTLEAEFC